MFSAQKDVLGIIIKTNKKYTYPMAITSIIIFSALRLKYNVKVDAFLGYSIIVLTVLLSRKLLKIGKTLQFIGKHSGNIFMFHTFIYNYYFKEIIYYPRYWVLILALLLATCLLISVGLEQLKKFIGYDKFIRILDVSNSDF